MSPSEIEWQEMLRPSVVGGLVRLRRRLADSPALSATEARKLLGATYDNAGLDFDRALYLHEVVAAEITESRTIFQAVISVVLDRSSPPWNALLRRGRDALKALDSDTLACFDRAGALQGVPDANVLAWWDCMAARAYAELDMSHCAVGREAERRSLEYERQRLKDIPGAPHPVWKALDNNLAGYDIHSWICLAEGWAPKLVEVKGSTRLPPTFHLSRNEWDTAIRHSGTYFFQVWQLGTNDMLELSVAEVMAHVPTDGGYGRWQDVLIEIQPLR